MCCNPHPSLIRFGIYFFRKPVKFGVWYIRISTLSVPNSATSGARREAHDAFGDSRVPLSASVKMLNFRCGFALKTVCSVEIWGSESTYIQGISRDADIVFTSSCSVFPMYNVDRKICFSAASILVYILPSAAIPILRFHVFERTFNAS